MLKKVRPGEGEVKGIERSEARGLMWVCRKGLRNQIGRRREHVFKVELFLETEKMCDEHVVFDMKIYLLLIYNRYNRR